MKVLKKINYFIANNRSLLSNFSNLSLIQFVTLLVPLVTYPYLIRVIGTQYYGNIIFAQAIVSYCIIFIDFGFNLYATSEVSKNKSNKEKINEIFTNVISIKLIIYILIFIIFYITTFFLNFDYLLYFLTLCICIYDVFFPLWYFQGTEKMTYISTIIIPCRILSLVLIFLIIKDQSNYLMVPTIYAISSFVASLLSTYVILKIEKINLKFSHLSKIKVYIKNAYYIFISNLVISLYLASNRVIVGLFLGNVKLAYYDLAEKITGILKVVQSVISQTIYPKNNRDKNIDFIKKMLFASLIINSIIIGIVYFNANYIVSILGGSDMLDSIKILKILLFTVPIVGLSNYFGIQILLPFGFKKEFSRVILFSALFYIFSILTLLYFDIMTIINISLSLVIVEIFVAVFMFYETYKKNLWKKNMII